MKTGLQKGTEAMKLNPSAVYFQEMLTNALVSLLIYDCNQFLSFFFSTFFIELSRFLALFRLKGKKNETLELNNYIKNDISYRRLIHLCSAQFLNSDKLDSNGNFLYCILIKIVCNTIRNFVKLLQK
jgi:hypothetical protein